MKFISFHIHSFGLAYLLFKFHLNLITIFCFFLGRYRQRIYNFKLPKRIPFSFIFLITQSITIAINVGNSIRPCVSLASIFILSMNVLMCSNLT